MEKHCRAPGHKHLIQRDGQEGKSLSGGVVLLQVMDALFLQRLHQCRDRILKNIVRNVCGTEEKVV
jgi:hypothetical protein